MFNNKKSKLVDTLPDKPSDLLAVALNDLEACSQDSNYRINFETWHKPLKPKDSSQFVTDDTPQVCQVGFAGSVMAKTLQCDASLRIEAGDTSVFHKDTIKKLLALDELRKGYVRVALQRMGAKPDLGGFDVSFKGIPANIPDVEVDQRDYQSFIASMRGIIKTLQFYGL